MLIEISVNNKGQRLDVYLRENGYVSSRALAQKLIDSGHVQVNNQSTKPSYLLEEGDQVEFKEIEVAPLKLQPWEYPLNIAHEDKDIIVINKPNNLVMHPAPGHSDRTLVHALLAHTQELSMGAGERRPGIVHRIDKDTSGLVVIAKNDRAHQFLAEQFKNKTVHRVYYAICYGYFKEPTGSVEGLIARHPRDRKKFCLMQGGKDDFKEDHRGKWSKTHYRVLKELDSGLSLVELKLETGRTHQIRVHLHHIGHPLVGDKLYLGQGYWKNLKSTKLKNVIKELGRVALHAKELAFEHPTTLERLHFSTEFPQNLTQLLEDPI